MATTPPIKTVAVLGARSRDRIQAVSALTEGFAALGMRTVVNPALGPADPVIDRLRRADWSTTFDTVIDLCATERELLSQSGSTDVLVTASTALQALAWYRVGLALREDEFDDTIRGWLEVPALGAAERYAVIVHAHPGEPITCAEVLVDQELTTVLRATQLAGISVVDTWSNSDISHCFSAVAAKVDFSLAVARASHG